MLETSKQNNQASIEEIQKIYDLFVIKLNILKKDKDKIIQDIAKRIDEQKIAEKLQELKDKY